MQGTVNGVLSIVSTYYVRDASGNVMSIYTSGVPTVNSSHLTQSEIDLYGSSRLGVYNVSNDVQNCNVSIDSITNFIRGNKFFELSNHLGNVLATVSDRKLAVDSNNDGVVDYYNAEVVTANDYYPFGMVLNDRKYDQINGVYRYGFNNKEKDNDINGTGVNYDYGMRIYDTRIGRFLSTDPLTRNFPWSSPYSFAENDILRCIDLEGAEKYVVINFYDKAHFLGSVVWRAEDVEKNLVNLNIKDTKTNTNYNTSNKLVINYNTSTHTINDITPSDKDLNTWETGVLNKQDGENVNKHSNNSAGQFDLSIADPDHSFSGSAGNINANATIFTVNFHVMNEVSIRIPVQSINQNVLSKNLSNSDVGKGIKNGDLTLNSVIVVFRTQADLNKYSANITSGIQNLYGKATAVKSIVNSKYLAASDIKNNSSTPSTVGVVLQTSLTKKP